MASNPAPLPPPRQTSPHWVLARQGASRPQNPPSPRFSVASPPPLSLSLSSIHGHSFDPTPHVLHALSASKDFFQSVHSSTAFCYSHLASGPPPLGPKSIPLVIKSFPATQLPQHIPPRQQTRATSFSSPTTSLIQGSTISDSLYINHPLLDGKSKYTTYTAPVRCSLTQESSSGHPSISAK